MITWELATAYCGALLGINPFDQPNVQAAKDYVVAALAGYVEHRPRSTTVDAGDLPGRAGAAPSAAARSS